jgi:serine/threonine protein kinase
MGSSCSGPHIARKTGFFELYLAHYIGIKYRDFEPWNALLKQWFVPKIIDFGFSDANHTCAGWMGCHELKEAWHDPQLDHRVPFWFEGWMFKEFKIRLWQVWLVVLFSSSRS